MKKQANKGITLVALVITIIVLLILAGITMNTLIGSGLFNMASDAKTKTQQEQIREEIKIAYGGVQMDALLYKWNNEKKAQALEKELQKQDPDAKVVAVEDMLLVSYKGYEATIDSKENITLEDNSMGAKPTGSVEILNKEDNAIKVQLKVIASVVDSEIEEIEVLNGAVFLNNDEEGNPIYEVTENGKYYFRLKAKNGRTAIIASEEINNIIIASESLLKAIEGINTSGIHKVKVSGKTSENEQDTVVYSLHTIVYDGDLHLDGKDTETAEKIEGLMLEHVEGWKDLYVLGDSDDTANSSGRLAQNTVVLKVNGNLTIDENVYITTVYDANGYGGPKGLVIYCTGTLTNNGVISMTRGGAKAVGENVFLWKNADTNETYEYVPAVGATGGASYTATALQTGSKRSGNPGNKGINRALGGGGTGAVYAYNGTIIIGAGGTATSYSGGAGSGGVSFALSGGVKGTDPGSSIGGAGSRGYRGSGMNTSGGGGAGNPRGYTQGSGTSAEPYAEHGTGGLLVIYGNKIENTGAITSEGRKGSDAVFGGGSSGGGSINIFYVEEFKDTGSFSVKGGLPAGKTQQGGAGGAGSISIGNISSGSYESTYTNY